MPREITPPTPNRHNKRTRVFRACQYCVSAKTRCEDVQPIGGCYLCRRKGKECSLAGLGVGLDHSQDGHVNESRRSSYNNINTTSKINVANLNNGIEGGQGELINRIETQEERYKNLEEKFRLLEEKFNVNLINQQQAQQSPSNSINTINTNGTIRDQDQSIIPPRTYAAASHPLLIQSWHMNSPIFDENLFGATDPNSLPDVVELGLLSRDQLEMGFQLFKHRFSLIYPFYPFLLSSTNRPKNSFINLVILYYINTYTESANTKNENISNSNNNGNENLICEEILIKLIEQSIFAILSGSVNNDSIFGLFILSLSPVKKNLPPRSQTSSLRMISLAYQIGKSLGLEQIWETALKNGSRDLVEAWSEKKLDLVLLWTAIVNRYNILHIISTPYSRTIPSPALQLPENHPSETVRITIDHLRGEAELVNSVESLLGNLTDTEIEWSPEKLDQCIESAKDMRKTLEIFRQNLSHNGKDMTGLISIDSRCIEFSLIIRLAVINQKLPSPISPLIRAPGLTAIGQNYLPISLALLHLLSDTPVNGDSNNKNHDHSRYNNHQQYFPSYVILSICTAYVCMRRAIVYVSQHHPRAHLTEYEILKNTETNLIDIGGSPKLIVQHTNQQLGPLNDHFNNNAINYSNSTPLSISQLPQPHDQGYQQHLQNPPQQQQPTFNNNIDFPAFDWASWDWTTLLVDPSFEQTGV